MFRLQLVHLLLLSYHSVQVFGVLVGLLDTYFLPFFLFIDNCGSLFFCFILWQLLCYVSEDSREFNQFFSVMLYDV